LDHFVINHEGIDTNQPGSEERVLSHPLVQAELSRQRRDLEELLGASEEDTLDLVVRIRDRAKTESKLIFTGVESSRS
jgi:hypothetical protein